MRRFGVRALAGLEIGMAAGVLTQCWMLLGGWLAGFSPWSLSNLAAESFYGVRAASPAFGMPTLAGIALHLLTSAVAAIALAVVVPERWSWPIAFGASSLYAVAGQWALAEWVWKNYSPALHSYAPALLVWSAALLFGFCLSFTPKVVRSFTRDFLVD